MERIHKIVICQAPYDVCLNCKEISCDLKQKKAVCHHDEIHNHRKVDGSFWFAACNSCGVFFNTEEELFNATDEKVS